MKLLNTVSEVSNIRQKSYKKEKKASRASISDLWDDIRWFDSHVIEASGRHVCRKGGCKKKKKTEEKSTKVFYKYV